MTAAIRKGLLLSAGLVAGATLTGVHRVLADRDADTVEAAAEGAAIPFEELRVFTEVLDRVRRDYVEEVSDQEMIESAIRGLLGGLDPHSTYLDEEAFRELHVGTSGEFGGLGIEVGMEDGFVKVISPIDDTPADEAGVQAGDLIIRLDDTPVKGLSLGDAVKIMRGKPGTEIDLTIVREGEEGPLNITVVRDVIRVQSVKSRMLAPGYGYLRITQFQSRTSEMLARAVSELKDERGEALEGMVLDLRNNPGGVLSGAVEVADAFLEKGLVVYTEGRSGTADQKFNATPGDVLYGKPMVVLINEGSASASEIVAGALQDHGRAIVMGRRSFGKGTVQTIFPLANDTGVKLTTAYYYTPDGRSIQAKQVVPDIVLEKLRLAEAESGFEPVREASLSGHLPNGDGDGSGDGSDEAVDAVGDPAGGWAELARTDFELYQALNLLKGLTLLQGRRD